MDVIAFIPHPSQGAASFNEVDRLKIIEVRKKALQVVSRESRFVLSSGFTEPRKSH
jgi:hypothetical protein